MRATSSAACCRSSQALFLARRRAFSFGAASALTVRASRAACFAVSIRATRFEMRRSRMLIARMMASRSGSGMAARSSGPSSSAAPAPSLSSGLTIFFFGAGAAFCGGGRGPSALHMRPNKVRTRSPQATSCGSKCSAAFPSGCGCLPAPAPDFFGAGVSGAALPSLSAASGRCRAKASTSVRTLRMTRARFSSGSDAMVR
mmetsp:Transcript_13334/g.39669  ORF Transcript_13334/g.39669 Transcript_13334/m.39669 type:complete len:201 (+) Transcript_13334:498-1100(+)